LLFSESIIIYYLLKITIAREMFKKYVIVYVGLLVPSKLICKRMPVPVVARVFLPIGEIRRDVTDESSGCCKARTT